MTTFVEVGLAIKSSLEAVAATLIPTHPIKRVDYGDIDRVTESVQVCVEPETKRTELRSIGRGVARRFRVHVYIYFAFVTNPEYNRESCDRLAEAIESHLNESPTLGGLVINGMVTEVASGMARKDGMSVRAARVTYEAESVDRLPL